MADESSLTAGLSQLIVLGKADYFFFEAARLFYTL